METQNSQGHWKWLKTLFGAESMYKYLQTLIEVLKWCIRKSTYNNNNYE